MANQAIGFWTEKDFGGSIPGRSYFGKTQGGAQEIPGYSAFPQTAQEALISMNALLAALADRLAPVLVSERVNINLAIGATSAPINLASKSINGLIINVFTGIVRVYIGSPSQSTLLYQFQAATNPFPVRIPQRGLNSQMYIECVGNSPADATGVIDLVQY